MNKTINTHSHSIITLGVVLVATLFGYGIEALLLMSGIWFGREHSQAEYRYMKLHHITREHLSDIDGFKLEAWDTDSFFNDLVIPILVGLLTIWVLHF